MVTLNPEMKYKYFENEWEDRPDWIEDAKSTVELVWTSEYKSGNSNTNDILLPPVATRRVPAAQLTNTTISPVSCKKPDLGNLQDWKKKKRPRLIQDDRDELQRYLERETEDDLPSGPLRYWIDLLQDIHLRK